MYVRAHIHWFSIQSVTRSCQGPCGAAAKWTLSSERARQCWMSRCLLLRSPQTQSSAEGPEGPSSDPGRSRQVLPSSSPPPCPQRYLHQRSVPCGEGLWGCLQCSLDCRSSSCLQCPRCCRRQCRCNARRVPLGVWPG